MTKLEDLEAATKLQCSEGNWDYDPYMHGMANGMIFALATIKGEDPKYLEAPGKWGSEKPPAEALAERSA